MTEKFDKGTSEIVDKINARMITGESGVDELKKALLLTVAAYRDYRHYGNTVEQLFDDFDESVEHLAPNTWFFRDGEDADAAIITCYSALDSVSRSFSELEKRAEENCAMIVKAALSAPPSVQKSVLSRVYGIKPGEVDAKIAELFETLGEAEYHVSMPDNLRAFLELMAEQWAAG